MTCPRQSRLRGFLLVAIVAAGAVANGASVRYGDATYLNPKLGIYDATGIGGGDYWLLVFAYNGTPSSDKFSIVSGVYYENNFRYLIESVKANHGDLAGAEYFSSRTDFFTKDVVDANGTTRSGQDHYSIFLEPDESIYLAYHIDDNALGALYGWVELKRDNDNVVVMNSAIDLSGGSLVVGAIPEPSSVLLLSLGLALLSLRRGGVTQ